MSEKGVILNIESRVSRLIDEHRALSASCSKLTEERDALRDENRMLRQRIRTQESEIARLQLSDGLGGGGADREGARARVNRLLREVDRCIALLDKQE